MSEIYKLKDSTKAKEEKNPNLNYSLNNENTTSFNDDNDNDLNLSSTKNDNYLYGNDYTLKEKPSKIGNTRACFFIKNYPIISIGNNILLPLLIFMFMCLTYIYIWYLFVRDAGPLLKKMFNYSFLVYFISHTLAVFINPGIPSLQYHKKIRNDLRQNKINELDCNKCNICNLTYKLKDKIGHCYKCNICYYEYDHHCIWIGHCVCKYNKYYFGFFVFSLFIFLLTCFAMVFIKILKIYFIGNKG